MKDNFEKKFLTSFDRSYSMSVFSDRPNQYSEIERKFKDIEKIISLGSNYSYAPLGFDENSLSIELTKFNKILDFDLDKQEITVEPGLKIYDLFKFTLKYNLWLPQVPGYPFISLGGVVASNSHGKSCGSHGTIRNSIKEILLYHKSNGWLKLSNKENKEIFDLTIGGFGLTGTIMSIKFKLAKLESQVFQTEIEEVNSFEECYKKISENKDNSSFVYSWNRADTINKFGSGFIFKNKQIKNYRKNIKLKKMIENRKSNLMPFSLWNKYSISVVNSLFYKFNKLKPMRQEEGFFETIFPYFGKETYFSLFGKKGFIESQMLIPSDNLFEFINEFTNLQKKMEPVITLFSLKNMSGKQTLLRFEDNCICLTFDFTKSKKNLEFLDKLDALCIKYNCIPSIIKDSRLSKNVINQCYHHVDDFRNRLKNFDKQRCYQSAISKKLEI